MDGEIASAGFSRAAADELGAESPHGAHLVQQAWSYSPTKLGPSDFELLRVVGQGAFGKVSALKVLLQCHLLHACWWRERLKACSPEEADIKA